MSSNRELKEKFLKVYNLKSGNISESCRAVGISRPTYYEWATIDDDFNAAIRAIDEDLIDDTEGELKKMIKDCDAPAVKFSAIKFFLQTKGKHRGYVESHITEVRGEIDISHDRAKQIAEAYVKATVIDTKKEDHPVLPSAQGTDATA